MGDSGSDRRMSVLAFSKALMRDEIVERAPESPLDEVGGALLGEFVTWEDTLGLQEALDGEQ